MLNTETNTRAMERRILGAARREFGRRKVRAADFEHGQWWVTLADWSQWSVCDAEPGPFCFEQVTEASE
jgi:hypothetical protein